MRFRILVVLSLAAASAVAASSAKADCSYRGNYCDYPLWATNAFEGPRHYTPPSATHLPRQRPESPRRHYREARRHAR